MINPNAHQYAKRIAENWNINKLFTWHKYQPKTAAYLEFLAF